MHGTLMHRGSSNCFGFNADAACTRTSIGFNFAFLPPVFEGLVAAGVDEDLLFRVCGVTLFADAYLQLWHNHSPDGISDSSNGGSLVKQINNCNWKTVVCLCIYNAYWHCKWKLDGHLSQQMRSPPSEQASQKSWLCPFPGRLKYGCSDFFVDFSLDSSLCGGAINACTCYNTNKAFVCPPPPRKGKRRKNDNRTHSH